MTDMKPAQQLRINGAWNPAYFGGAERRFEGGGGFTGGGGRRDDFETAQEFLWNVSELFLRVISHPPTPQSPQWPDILAEYRI